MKRWSRKEKLQVESEQADNFINDLIAVCKKHRLTLAHEDTHGSFIVCDENEENLRWLRAAVINDDIEK